MSSEGIFYFTAWVNFRACTLLQLNQYSNSFCTSTWVNNVYTFATTGSKSDKYFNTLNIRHRESSISMRIKTLIFKTIFTCYIDCFLLIYLFLNFFFFLPISWHQAPLLIHNHTLLSIYSSQHRPKYKLIEFKRYTVIVYVHKNRHRHKSHSLCRRSLSIDIPSYSRIMQ